MDKHLKNFTPFLLYGGMHFYRLPLYIQGKKTEFVVWWVDNIYEVF